MKKIIHTSLLLLPLMFISCVSLPNNSADSASESTVEKNENAKESNVVHQNPEEIAFIKSLENVKLAVVSAPKYTSAGSKFNSDFKVSVADVSGSPLVSYSICVSYPAEKSDGKILYKTETVVSDERGLCVFTPSVESTVFPCNAKITFMPAPVSESEAVVKAAEEKAVSADWKVRSDITKKGAVLFIWEFNELNRPTRNSYDVLSDLKGYGIWNVGNAPVNEPSDISKSIQTLYRENYEIIENQYGYLIAGTIKFSKPVEKLESGDGYSCTLTGDITAVRMKDGKVVFHQVYEQYAEGSNWNKVTETAKSKIAEKITESLIYGL